MLVFTLSVLVGLAIVAGAFLYAGRGFLAWIVPGVLGLGAWAWQVGQAGGALPVAFWIVLGGFAACVLLFALPPMRRLLVTRPVFAVMKRALPRIGKTERVALDAGSVWWDGELFSGRPNWPRMFAVKPGVLAERERAFLDGPCETVCRMANDWDIWQRRDLSPEVWAYLKEQKFFGMIIPEAYGGLGFSALAHSAVITKLGSRSTALCVTVMVPNSLGPAELLMHYGTDEQKKHYLPRLATGAEVPCFALTGPEAGSDAAATQSVGIVCEGEWEGETVLGMRLSWNKRYITLSSVATVIGLAFRLLDPEHRLGDKDEIGITCALVPADLPGIEIGKRHDPMGVPFINGPTVGTDVFVPLSFIIGGRERAGDGWRMLMENLAAGRGISLPSLSAGGAQAATRLVGAYASVREQFDTPIGRFEGIEEPLARIGGYTHVIDAAREVTAAAIDAGETPAVASAIVKAYCTEALRRVVNDAMDVRAGAGISRGPRNLLARGYAGAPIGITVEGANILTRSMIIYGQGAIRCHPYVREEMEAVSDGDLKRFDRAFFGHVGFVFSNAVRAWWLGLTGSRFARGYVKGPVGRYLRQFTRMSAAFALTSDVAMGVLGGKLKRKEKLSGRLADALAWMYLAACVLKRFCDNGQPEIDRPYVKWARAHALYEIQEALLGILENFPNRLIAFKLKRIIFPWGPRFRPVSDALGAEVARGLLEDRENRQRLTRDMFVPPADELGLGRLEAALDKAVEARAVETKLRDAVRQGKLDRAPGDLLLESALAAGIVSEAERQKVLDAKEARDEVIQVDAFDFEKFAGMPS